ncbi:MAG: N-acetylmuramoyl-L-alanine amidase, partial [bacterium]
WNMFTISRDGEIYQHFDPKYYSKYIGDKNGNKLAITIVLENMGSLIKLDDDRFVNWLNEPCEKKKVVERKWVGYTYWENIPEIQLKKTAELCSKLCNDFVIPKTCIEFRHYHKDIKKFKGIVFRGNYFDDSGDLNPLFNINKFSEMLDDE